MSLDGTSIIGNGRGTSTGSRFQAVNPASGELLVPEFTSASDADIERAVHLAAEAFETYGEVSGKGKAMFLRRIAENLEGAGAEITERAQQETALPAARLQSELGRTCGQLRLFATLIEEGSWVDARIDHADSERKPLPKPDLRSMLRPLGPVAVFGASNFPLAFSVAGGDTASALSAGCPVVVKAHPAHPGTSLLAGLAVQKAVRDSGLHEGVFSLLFDAQYEVGLRLVQHPAVRAVAFTGSRRGGHALMDAAARRREPIPVYAEMGSINPVFILPGALRKRSESIAAGLHASVTLGVGQFCTNPGVVIAERGAEVEALARDLEARMTATPAATMLTGGICDAYHAGVARLMHTRGVDRRVSPKAGERTASPALFVTNAATFLAEEAIRDEVFGPATLIVECDASAQLLEIARSLEGQLSITVHATEDDLVAHRELIRILEKKAGRIVFNGYPTGLEVSHATVHGGPYPATSDGRSTSVGTRAIERFVRPVCYQDCPDELLPPELREANPSGMRRLVDGQWR